MAQRKRLTGMLALLLLATSMLTFQPKAQSENLLSKKITFEKIWSISEKVMGGHLLSEYGDNATMFRGPNTSVPFVNKEGNLYVVGYNESVHEANNIICLTPDGKLKWKFPIPGKSFVTKLKLWMDGSGNLYFMTWQKQQTGKKYDYTLYSINPAGKKRWSYAIRNVIYEERYKFHVLPDGSTVLVSQSPISQAHLYLLNANGKVVHHRLIKDNEFLSFQAAQNGRLIFYHSTNTKSSSYTVKLLVMDQQGNTIREIAGFERASMLTAYPLPDKKLLLYYEDRNDSKIKIMTAIDAYGKKLWSKRVYAKYNIPNDILVSGNTIYHPGPGPNGEADGALYRTNGTTGSVEAKYNIQDRDSIEFFYIGSYQNNLGWDEDSITYALVPHDLSRPVDNRVYLQSTGNLIVLDPITLREIGMYKYPHEDEELAKWPFGMDRYFAELISSSHDEAFFYYKDKATATRQLVKVKLKYEDQPQQTDSSQ